MCSFERILEKPYKSSSQYQVLYFFTAATQCCFEGVGTLNVFITFLIVKSK